MAADSPQSASSAASSETKSGPDRGWPSRRGQTGRDPPEQHNAAPRGWRNEDGSRSKRKNRAIERTPGSPGRSSSLPLVRPGSVFCAGYFANFSVSRLDGAVLE